MVKFSKKIRETDKKTLVIYFIVRLLIIGCLVLEAIHQNWSNVFLCLITLILITLPALLEKHFKLMLPNFLESLIILFIFASIILGEINNFFGNVPHWDTVLHTINGFVCAGLGFSLVNLLNKNSDNINLSPVYLLLVSFSFSMTIGVLWEFVEYGIDKVLLTDMQKDVQVTQIASVYLNEDGENKAVILNDISYTLIYSVDEDGNEIETRVGGYIDLGINDTMKDLFVNFLGAIIFNLLAYLYILDNKKWPFIEKFLIKRINV